VSERVGLMGGTFDPVHYGHLVMAAEAGHCFKLDRVIWMPAGDPPHKDDSVTPQEHRYAMVVLATATHPGFEVSRHEMEREGPSYSLHTIRHVQVQLPDAELFFILGADAVLELLTWHRHEEVIQACRIIAAARLGYDLEQLKEVLPPAYLERIDAMKSPGVDISSRDLRTRVKAGRPIRYLVPEPVEAYIDKHRLYRR